MFLGRYFKEIYIETSFIAISTKPIFFFCVDCEIQNEVNVFYCLESTGMTKKIENASDSSLFVDGLHSIAHQFQIR